MGTTEKKTDEYNKELYNSLVEALQSDIREDKRNFPEYRPLLAHYTSIANLDNIVRGKELWLSNPLVMNDLQEVRFGISQSTALFLQHQGIREACGNDERYGVLISAYGQYVSNFEQEHSFDLYVACFSEHTAEDFDGRLAMWRGYGANGGGASLVFDSNKLPVQSDSALILTRVAYGSDNDRLKWISKKLDEFALLLSKAQPELNDLYLAAYALFDRFVLFSVCSKHIAFDEEREWRLVYMKHRRSDAAFENMLSYAVGPTGVQPKLKYAIERSPSNGKPQLSLSSVIDRIILGPTSNGAIAKKSVQRMLDMNQLGALREHVFVSSIPYRPT